MNRKYQTMLLVFVTKNTSAYGRTVLKPFAKTKFYKIGPALTLFKFWNSNWNFEQKRQNIKKEKLFGQNLTFSKKKMESHFFLCGWERERKSEKVRECVDEREAECVGVGVLRPLSGFFVSSFKMYDWGWKKKRISFFLSPHHSYLISGFC
jgi:hypothetical protein